MPDEDTEAGIDRAELLEITREEAHRTIDKQIETLEDIDEKASQILRLNLLLLSIVLTGFSIIAADNGVASVTNESAIVNPYLVIGILSIILSTTVAAFTYTASNKKSGMSGRDIASVLEGEYSPEQD